LDLFSRVYKHVGIPNTTDTCQINVAAYRRKNTCSVNKRMCRLGIEPIISRI